MLCSPPLGKYSPFPLLLHKSFAISLAVLGLSISSQFGLALPFVPLTLQTLGLFFMAFLLPPGQAFLSVLTWITLGSAGAPLLAGFSGGPHILLGATGGYLWGMLIAAPLMSFLFKKMPPSFLARTLVSSLGGSLVLFLGFLQLRFLLNDGPQAFQYGVLPFLLGDALKVIVASSFFKILKPSLKRSV